MGVGRAGRALSRGRQVGAFSKAGPEPPEPHCMASGPRAPMNHTQGLAHTGVARAGRPAICGGGAGGPETARARYRRH